MERGALTEETLKKLAAQVAKSIRGDRPEPVTFRSKQAAAYVNLSEWKFLELVRAGKIPKVEISPRLYLFRRETLDNWLTNLEK